MKLTVVERVLAGINVPKVSDVVFGEDTRKLSRRPSYESLASASQLNNATSSGSLCELGKGGDDGPADLLFSNVSPAAITPEAAQNAFVSHLVGGGSAGAGAGRPGASTAVPPPTPVVAGGFVQVPGVGPVNVARQQQQMQMQQQAQMQRQLDLQRQQQMQYRQQQQRQQQQQWEAQQWHAQQQVRDEAH